MNAMTEKINVSTAEPKAVIPADIVRMSDDEIKREIESRLPLPAGLNERGMVFYANRVMKELGLADLLYRHYVGVICGRTVSMSAEDDMKYKLSLHELLAIKSASPRMNLIAILLAAREGSRESKNFYRLITGERNNEH